MTRLKQQLNETKSRGITAPGWWSYFTYTDSSGATRHKAEQLVFIANLILTSTETQADDAIAADVASAVTITVQPANSTSSSGAGTYTCSHHYRLQEHLEHLHITWQRQTATGKRWVNIAAGTDTGITYADFTTATLAYSGLAGDTLDGNKFRVKVTSAGGTEK